MKNPFTPSFGTSPPLLAGRGEVLDEFSYGIEAGPGAGGRAVLYTGARGSGKTVMLNEVQEIARASGWLVVSETATPGLLNRLTHSRLASLLGQFEPEAVIHSLSGVNLPIVGGGLTWETIRPEVVKTDLRGQVELITDMLRDHGSGLLITIDEVHRGQLEDLRQIAAVVQHAFREDREVAFAAAGLQASVSDLLQDEVLTFLRRAEQHHLGAVDFTEVRSALKEPIAREGRQVSEEALEKMTRGTRGYPFLIQLVGDRSWRQANASGKIGLAEADRGVAEARSRLGSLIHAPALKKVSEVDRSFLLAMTRDEGPSRTRDIAMRLGQPQQYIGVYRARLIDLELITVPRRGYVEFALPYLREYLRDQVASEP